MGEEKRKTCKRCKKKYKTFPLHKSDPKVFQKLCKKCCENYKEEEQ